MIKAIAEALGHNIYDLVIGWSSIHICYTKLRIKIAKKVKTKFRGNSLSFAVKTENYFMRRPLHRVFADSRH